MFLLSDSKKARLLRLIIAVIAILNLIAIFVFNYSLPSFLRKAKDPGEKIEVTTSASTESEAAPEETKQITPEEAGWKFSFDPEILEYDGSEELNLLAGVAVLDPNGAVSELNIFSHIKTGNSLSEKIIEYSADTPDGQLVASRTLNLVGYEGPSLSIPSKLPGGRISSPEDLLDELEYDSDFFAKDGFGNDITKAITVDFSRPEDSTTITCLFTVTNMFNDTVSQSGEMKATLKKPIVFLTTTNLTLNRGKDFYPTTYLKSAIDVDGSDLTAQVFTDGVVDSYTVGDYELLYKVIGSDGEESDPVTLTVHIIE